MDLLLHICCGPCLVYPFKRLAEKGIKPKGFYYNPNIYPLDEFEKRKSSLELLNKELGLEIEIPVYRQDEFFDCLGQVNQAPERCLRCYSLRLKKTARRAKEKGILNFSTTLLVSPYQNHEKLKETGINVAKEFGLNFFYEDFRPGFREAYKEAREKGLYLQKYCGCKYSYEKK